MAILDQPGGNANASFQPAIHERPAKAYPWVCTNPGCSAPNQVGRIEDGCLACGAGADATQGQPLPPTDFNCSACKGSGTVERKCGLCDGTGMTDPPQLGEPPGSCEKCGGAGTIALGCGRCDGSGIDPEPVQKVARPLAIPQAAIDAVQAMGEQINAPGKSLAQPLIDAIEKRATPPSPAPSAGIFKLPSIDDPEPVVTSSDTVVRYRLIRYEGSAAQVDRTIGKSLHGTAYPGSGEVAITALEIAAPKSPALLDHVAHAAKQTGQWDGKF